MKKLLDFTLKSLSNMGALCLGFVILCGFARIILEFGPLTAIAAILLVVVGFGCGVVRG